MEKTLRTLEKHIPKNVYKFFQPVYHYLLSFTGAILYRFPSKKIKVIVVTGTKGKSSTCEFVNAVFEADGKKTALLSTIRFKIGNSSKPNLYKMTVPGRFFVQKFLRDAVDARCDVAIMEMTSEGARFFRHNNVHMDGLIFTNLSPEHIESHGSFENYLHAKLRIAKRVAKSKKDNKKVVANIDNPYGKYFLIYDVEHRMPYSLTDVTVKEKDTKESTVVYKDTTITIHLPGEFNILNALAAIKLGELEDISLSTIKKGIESLTTIRGRVEKVQTEPFEVVIDYAHTDDSLRKLYEAFPKKKKICVLGSTGGGRDSWKRKVMGEIADEHCDEIILTNEDPYDEDPQKIMNEVAEGITKHTPHMIIDRRVAIAKALALAKTKNVVLITGKGTDPYIMGPNGTKEVWDDATVAREELAKQLANSK